MLFCCFSRLYLDLMKTVYIFFEEIYKKRLDSKEGEKAVEALEHCISTNCSWLSMLLLPCRIENIQLTA